MRSTATLFKTLLTLEKRVTKAPSKIAYYTSQIFKALLFAFLSFLIIQVEEKSASQSAVRELERLIYH